MFELSKTTSLEDIVDQLSTVSDTVTEESSFIPASITLAIKTLAPSIEKKQEINIVICGIEDNELTENIALMRHYFPESIAINLLVLGTPPLKHIISHDNANVQYSHESLDQLLTRSRELRFSIEAIFIFNFNDDQFSEDLQRNLLQPSLRAINTKLFIAHNSNEYETPRLLALKRYNIVEQKTISNTYALEEGETYISNRISLVSSQNATRTKGFVEAEPTLQKMINDSYFDKRFNSFGLHYSKNSSDGSDDINVIFFDYELCYDPFNYRIYVVRKGAFTLIKEFSSDPFSILTRSLKDKVYHNKQPDRYIPLADKEHAAKLRLHFGYLLKARQQAIRDDAEKYLVQQKLDATPQRITLNAKVIGGEHPVRSTTKVDVRAFSAFRNEPNTFAEEVKKEKSLFIAKDTDANELIFTIVKSDKYNDLLNTFIHCAHELDFDIYKTDSDGFTLLDNAVTEGAPHNAETLIRWGFDVNHKNPFGFTALHRAYATNNTPGKAILTKYGAKLTKNDFGKTPTDLAPQFDHDV